MDSNARIFICGHGGMVGSACVRRFRAAGCTRLILRSHAELELRDRTAVEEFFSRERPEYVVLAAAKVGGIMANRDHCSQFLLENLEIQNNVIMAAFRHKVKKFCFLGSSCIYPRECPQPIREEYLLGGPLEPTNEGYALAKIAGYKLCCYLSREFGWRTVSLMPCNLYGTNDNYALPGCHVFPALIRRFAEASAAGAPQVELWGTGRPLREFMHVDDLANAVWYFMQTREDPEFLNVGSGQEISIRELAGKIAAAAGYQGRIVWDESRPDGMPRKLMDCTRARRAGWQAAVSLDEGIRRTLVQYRQRYMPSPAQNFSAGLY